MSNKQHANGDDKRTRAEERIAALDTSPTKLMAELDELRGQLETAEQEAAENKAGWQRTAADFANYRRRTEQDREARPWPGQRGAALASCWRSSTTSTARSPTCRTSWPRRRG